MNKLVTLTCTTVMAMAVLPAMAETESCLDASQLAPLAKVEALPAEMATAISQIGQSAMAAYQSATITATAKQDCVKLLGKLQTMAGQPVIVAADPALYATLVLDVAKQGINLAAVQSPVGAQAAQLPAYQPPVMATDLLRR